MRDTEKSNALAGYGIFAHGRHPGHELKIDHKTQEWRHAKGAQEIANSKDAASPNQSAAALQAHLAAFHNR